MLLPVSQLKVGISAVLSKVTLLHVLSSKVGRKLSMLSACAKAIRVVVVSLCSIMMGAYEQLIFTSFSVICNFNI